MADSEQQAINIKDNEIPPEYEGAFQRAIISENLQFSRSFQDFLSLKKTQNSLEATKLLAKREIIEASKYNKEEEETLSEEKFEELIVKEKEIRSQLYKTFLKHATISDAIQNLVAQTQIQNNFYESLVKDKAGFNTSIRSSLTNLNENINSGSELVKKYEEEEQLEQDILEIRIKYREKLLAIEKKWKIISGQEPPENRSPETLEYEVRLQRREDRLSIIVGLLQGLISSSGEKWGANPRLLQILLLCDSRLGNVEDAHSMQSAIEDLKRIRLEPAEKAKSGIDVYFTSTPVTKKLKK